MEQRSKSSGGKLKEESKNSSEVFASCSFSSLGLHSTLCDQLKERLGFEVPTQVQAQAIPVVLSGRHVLVNAATGTGKTVAYLAPIIHLLQNYDKRIQRSDGTFALVLVPTRELCMQVYEILQKLLHRFHWIVPGYIMGGENRSKEKARLRKGVSILVATPGRLLDHLKNTSSFVHTNLRWIVFDEADRILELGYGKDIEEILNCLGTSEDKSVTKGNSAATPEVQKQNLLLSATLNEKSRRIQKMLSSSAEEYKLPAQLVQRYIKVPCGSRLVVLLSILKHLFEREASQKVVVFFSTCDAVDFHYFLLSEFQWPAMSQSETELRQIFLGCKTLRLHGNMNHEDRKTTFQTFKTENQLFFYQQMFRPEAWISQKSDASYSMILQERQLSMFTVSEGFPLMLERIPGLTLCGQTPVLYYFVAHYRVGRTARLGEKGDSILFLQPIEVDYMMDLEKHGVTLAEYPLLKLLNSFPLYGPKHQVKKFVSIEMHPWLLTLQRALESFISAELKLKKLAKDAFCSWVRAYTAHRGELKQIFMVKKLHLGHVAKSFALKEQPSLVNKSIQKQIKKRKRDDRQKVKSKKRVSTKS
ncbi:UNVERIFIED_CONTAM: DEAD-box ATP-dependent RNA helicase 17 [Sesamum calycinum]|uniref:ATP-dependent RNA helicase n=1 Tax=Sesamum calycinum TaxID=2727403 RepID=A0AAW2NSL2_9LAMI